MKINICIHYSDLRTRELKEVRDVSIHGKLAIHIMLGVSDSYTVTHLPTGWAIKHYLTKMQAIKIVNRILHFDLNFKDPENIPRITYGQIDEVLKDVLNK